MYQMKVLIFIEEILSLIVAPWILLRNANSRCERIVDFFREQTVHVDGIGYQCNFAVFGFKKDLNAEDPTTALNGPDGLRDDYYGLKDDKMAASVQNFMQYYSHYNQRKEGRRAQGWYPPPSWPPLTSPPVIAEATEAVSARAVGTARPPSAKRSGYLDPRQQRSPRHVPRNPRDARAPSHRPDAARKMGSSALQDVTESVLMRQDSDLNNGYNHPEREIEPSDTEEETDGEAKTVGVLGMLYQFSKAQTEKGAGVNI